LKDKSNSSGSTVLIVHKNKQKHENKNLQIFILARDALTERKTRSVLTRVLKDIFSIDLDIFDTVLIRTASIYFRPSFKP